MTAAARLAIIDFRIAPAPAGRPPKRTGTRIVMDALHLARLPKVMWTNREVGPELVVQCRRRSVRFCIALPRWAPLAALGGAAMERLDDPADLPHPAFVPDQRRAQMSPAFEHRVKMPGNRCPWRRRCANWRGRVPKRAAPRAWARGRWALRSDRAGAVLAAALGLVQRLVGAFERGLQHLVGAAQHRHAG